MPCKKNANEKLQNYSYVQHLLDRMLIVLNEKLYFKLYLKQVDSFQV